MNLAVSKLSFSPMGLCQFLGSCPNKHFIFLLRSSLDAEVSCTDASMVGAGICVGHAPRAVLIELWRNSETRGAVFAAFDDRAQAH